MTTDELVLKLRDSKRFCQLFSDAGKAWTKRALTDEDKCRLLLPVVEIILDTFQAPVQPKVRQVAAPTSAPDKSGITLGSMADAAELPFNPFEQPGMPPLEPMKPDAPIDPVAKRQEQVALLKSVIDTQQGWDMGTKRTIRMPAAFNANEAAIFFQALGTHILAPGPNGSFGVMVVPGGGWDVTCIRVK